MAIERRTTQAVAEVDLLRTDKKVEVTQEVVEVDLLRTDRMVEVAQIVLEVDGYGWTMSRRLDMMGFTPHYFPAFSSQQFTNADHSFLHVKNQGPVDTTVTIAPTKSSYAGLAIASLMTVVPDGEERMIGPLLARLFNDEDGYVTVTLDETGGVWLALFQLRRLDVRL